jgi:hypothetical protein
MRPISLCARLGLVKVDRDWPKSVGTAKLIVDSTKPESEGCSKADSSEIISGEFVVAGGDTPEVFEATT